MDILVASGISRNPAVKSKVNFLITNNSVSANKQTIKQESFEH